MDPCENTTNSSCQIICDVVNESLIYPYQVITRNRWRNVFALRHTSMKRQHATITGIYAIGRALPKSDMD